MTLRLMTYNVHRCVGVDKKLDIPRVAAVIAAMKPDVVALQELDVGRERTGRVDQAHELAQRLGMRRHFNAAMNVEEEQYGDAILTALPETLVKAGALFHYHRVPKNEPRGAVWITVEKDGVEVQVINTHLGLLPREQQKQATALIGDWMTHPKWKGPGVLMGDFNATPYSATYRMFAAVLRDAQSDREEPPTATFPSGFPLLRIDHVFLAGGLTATSVESPYDARARKASDHLPLLVEVAFPA